MAQLPNDRVPGSSADSAAAPGTLNLADVLQALALGARLTLSGGQGDEHLSFTLPSPPPPTSPPTVPLGQSIPTVGAPSGSGGVSSTPGVGRNSGGRSAGKAKAEPENYPCARCAAHGCLPPPSEEPFEEEPQDDIDETANHPTGDPASTRWYSVTVGRRVGVFHNWTNVAPWVVRVSGAVYSKCSSRAAAEAAFNAAVEAGAVHVIE